MSEEQIRRQDKQFFLNIFFDDSQNQRVQTDRKNQDNVYQLNFDKEAIAKQRLQTNQKIHPEALKPMWKNIKIKNQSQKAFKIDSNRELVHNFLFNASDNPNQSKDEMKSQSTQNRQDNKSPQRIKIPREVNFIKKQVFVHKHLEKQIINERKNFTREKHQNPHIQSPNESLRLTEEQIASQIKTQREKINQIYLKHFKIKTFKYKQVQKGSYTSRQEDQRSKRFMDYRKAQEQNLILFQNQKIRSNIKKMFNPDPLELQVFNSKPLQLTSEIYIQTEENQTPVHRNAHKTRSVQRNFNYNIKDNFKLPDLFEPTKTSQLNNLFT